MAWRIACGQILAWGTLFYAFSIVVEPMQRGTGWSRSFLNSGLSLGLLIWGVCAIPVGAWIQRRGGRELMTIGSLLGGGALASMGLAVTPAAYICEWIALGIAMAALLYDPAFAVVTAAFGSHYRRGIVLITLVAGFASTVFIPLTHLLETRLGWNDALVALGSLQIVVGVPLHFFGLPKTEREHALLELPPVTGRLREWCAQMMKDASDRRFLGLAIWFTAHTAGFSGMTFLLIPMLQSSSVHSGVILGTVAFIGPAQVLGRLMLVTKGEGFKALQVGRWAMSALVASIVIFTCLPWRMPWLAAFAVIYGAGNGVITILRGTSISELFGRHRYAELNGLLAAPAVLAKAASPLVLAILWSASNSSLAVCLGVLVLFASGAVGLEWAKYSGRVAESAPEGPDLAEE